MRQQQREMKLGEGGEGYVADDEWCYNCGNVGHWGDVSCWMIPLSCD